MRETKNNEFESRADTLAIVVTALGFFARLWAASGTFLNPDEALHFRLANQLSLTLAYKESLTASHPPLLTVILYYWRDLGMSELWLRMPSVIAGAVFCWMFYKWLGDAAGKLTGLVGLLFAAFLPPIVLLSTEIRQYSLLLAFLASALYFLDDAFEKKSAGRMLAFAVCLYLAMLSHYSAFLFAAALGIYALAKFFSGYKSIRLLAVWAGGQFGALALAAVLYKTHLAKLGAGESRSVLQGWMSEFFLRRSYFDASHDNPLLFAVSRSFGVFQFVFGQLAIGDVAGLLFLAALVYLVRGTQRGYGSSFMASRMLALFLILSFALVCGASLAHFYPYGGTRHSALLIIPAVAGVSIALVELSHERRDRSVALAMFIVLLCVVFGKEHQPYMRRSDQSHAHMNDAIAFTRENARIPALIFTDYESELILGHYLCNQRPIAFEESVPQFEVFSYDSVRVVSASYKTATIFDADQFLGEWPRLVEAYHLQPGTTVWIVQAGWKVDLGEDLQKRFAEFHDLRIESFGNNMKFFKLIVRQPMPALSSQARVIFPPLDSMPKNTE